MTFCETLGHRGFEVTITNVTFSIASSFEEVAAARNALVLISQPSMMVDGMSHLVNFICNSLGSLDSFNSLWVSRLSRCTSCYVATQVAS